MPDDSLKDRFLKINATETDLQATAARSDWPEGWRPGVRWEGQEGEITLPPMVRTPVPTDWAEALSTYGLDPETVEIIDDRVRFTAWDGWRRDDPNSPAYTAVQRSYRADIRLRKPSEDPSLEEIYKAIKRKKPSKKTFSVEGDTLIIALSDWQTGNFDGGGAEAQIAVLAGLPEAISRHVANLRRGGREIAHIVVAGMGDLFEQCSNYYSTQTWSVELTRREQYRVIRRALIDIVATVAGLAPQVTVTAVGGNHGENRSAGKLYTHKSDNDDIAVFEAVADAFSLNRETFSHVTFNLPHGELATSFNFSGTIVAFTHGHVARYKTNAAHTMWTWWADQMMGRAYPGVADAEILIAGHFHHLNVKEQEGRALFICPSLTQVSEYYGDATGVRSKPGTLTLIISDDGWVNFEILR